MDSSHDTESDGTDDDLQSSHGTGSDEPDSSSSTSEDWHSSGGDLSSHPDESTSGGDTSEDPVESSSSDDSDTTSDFTSSTTSEYCEIHIQTEKDRVCCGEKINGSVSWSSSDEITVTVTPAVTIIESFENGYSWEYQPTEADCGTFVTFTATGCGDGSEDEGISVTVAVVKVILTPNPMPTLLALAAKARDLTINFRVLPDGAEVAAQIVIHGQGFATFEDESLTRNISYSGSFTIYAYTASGSLSDVELQACSSHFFTIVDVRIEKVWENLAPAVVDNRIPLLSNINYFTRSSCADTGNPGPPFGPYPFILTAQWKGQDNSRVAHVQVQFSVKPNIEPIVQALNVRFMIGEELIGSWRVAPTPSGAPLDFGSLNLADRGGQFLIAAGFDLNADGQFTMEDVLETTTFRAGQFTIRIITVSDYNNSLNMLAFGLAGWLARARFSSGFLRAFMYDLSPTDVGDYTIVETRLHHNETSLHHNVGGIFSPLLNTAPMSEYHFANGSALSNAILDSDTLELYIIANIFVPLSTIVRDWFANNPDAPSHLFTMASDADFDPAFDLGSLDLCLAFGSARADIMVNFTVDRQTLAVTSCTVVGQIKDLYNWHYGLSNYDTLMAVLQAGYGKCTPTSKPGHVFRTIVVFSGPVIVNYTFPRN